MHKWQESTQNVGTCMQVYTKLSEVGGWFDAASKLPKYIS